MIKIYKTDENTGILNSISQVQEQSWIHMVRPTKEEIDLVARRQVLLKVYLLRF